MLVINQISPVVKVIEVTSVRAAKPALVSGSLKLIEKFAFCFVGRVALKRSRILLKFSSFCFSGSRNALLFISLPGHNPRKG